MLYNSIANVLGLHDGKDWIQVRRELTDEQISTIYSLYEGLWPRETDLLSLLPKPDGNARSVYTGSIHPTAIVKYALGASIYFSDAVVLVAAGRAGFGSSGRQRGRRLLHPRPRLRRRQKRLRLPPRRRLRSLPPRPPTRPPERKPLPRPPQARKSRRASITTPTPTPTTRRRQSSRP